MAMKVYLGADHRGFDLKNQLKDWLLANNYEVEDLGAYQINPEDDYVDFALNVAQKISSEEGSRGIVICGSGAGAEIAANKVKLVRCALGFDSKQISMARSDDDINVLALASSFSNLNNATELVKSFLETEFDPAERHVRRIEKINQLEN